MWNYSINTNLSYQVTTVNSFMWNIGPGARCRKRLKPIWRWKVDCEKFFFKLHKDMLSFLQLTPGYSLNHCKNINIHFSVTAAVWKKKYLSFILKIFNTLVAYTKLWSLWTELLNTNFFCTIWKIDHVLLFLSFRYIIIEHLNTQQC